MSNLKLRRHSHSFFNHSGNNHSTEHSKLKAVGHVLNWFNPYHWLSECEKEINKENENSPVYRPHINL